MFDFNPQDIAYAFPPMVRRAACRGIVLVHVDFSVDAFNALVVAMDSLKLLNVNVVSVLHGYILTYMW